MTDATVLVLWMVLIPFLILTIVVLALRLRAAVKRDQESDNNS